MKNEAPEKEAYLAQALRKAWNYHHGSRRDATFLAIVQNFAVKGLSIAKGEERVMGWSCCSRSELWC